MPKEEKTLSECMEELREAWLECLRLVFFPLVRPFTIWLARLIRRITRK